ncbi:MAG TPA: hypothetical protein VHD32_12725, partial [Candidatus Didemnitutus sp.]|nr:hypothetical protein [Candidatus Didemnitutus sp.]
MKPVRLFASLLAAGVAVCAAAEPEPKTHVLFAGVDISVQDQTELHPVEDVQGGSFIVHVNGQETKVAGNWTSVHMKVQSAMKIS